MAVVGDAHKSREPAVTKRAAEELGAELARRGYRLLVFSNDAAFIEGDFVRGYLGNEIRKQPKAIQVRYPPQLHRLFPGEKPNDELFDRQPQGSEWEVSFYPWLAAADGILLVGGGYTTKVAGLIAIGAKTPMMGLAGLGGSAERVLEYLRQERHAIAAEDELNLMAQPNWGSSSAALFVDALTQQMERKRALNARAEILTFESKRARALTLLAVTGCVLFIAVLLAIAEALQSGENPRWILWMLFGAPAIAGASGAAIRVIWDNYSSDPAPSLTLHPVGMTIALGFWASGVAGALFLLPQIVSLGTLEPHQAYRLLPFSALVGLLAGVTLEKVFRRLIKIDVPLDSGSLGTSESKMAAAKAPSDTA